MALLSIAASRHIDQVRRRLDGELKGLEREGFNIDIIETSRGYLTFLGCNVERQNPALLSTRDIVMLCRHYVANALSDLIIEDWEGMLVRKIIRQNYQHLSPEEQDAVFGNVEDSLEDTSGSRGIIWRITRKAKVLNKLLEYLDLNDVLILDGFVTFRLKDYLEELEEVVDQAVDEYLLDREYQEFIKLLRHFAGLQEPKAERIHVFLRPEGNFRMRDQNGRIIEDEFLSHCARDLVGEGIECEDVLISSLVTLAPSRVVIHRGGHSLSRMGTETLKGVFGERLEHCNGCSWCRGEPSGEKMT
jgi:putative sporulation protein YtxC